MSEISINLFRNIQKQTITISNDVSLIFGKNGSGKSNFLRAIDQSVSKINLRNSKIFFTYIPINRIKYNAPMYQDINKINTTLYDYRDKESRSEAYYRSLVDFVMSNSKLLNYVQKILFEVFDEEIRIEKYSEISDGHKSILSIINDIIFNAFKIDETNDFHLVKGIVLIDEIDTYIHQSIQMKIIDKLTFEFPNVKFILTTHSMVVIRKLKPDQNLYLIKDGRLIEQDHYYYQSIDNIGADLFEIDKYPEKVKKVNDFLDYLIFENPKKLDKESLNEYLTLIKEIKKEYKLIYQTNYSYYENSIDIIKQRLNNV